MCALVEWTKSPFAIAPASVARAGPPPALDIVFVEWLAVNLWQDLPPGTPIYEYIVPWWATSIDALNGAIQRTPQNAWPYDEPTWRASAQLFQGPGQYQMPAQGWASLQITGPLYWLVHAYLDPV